MADETRSVLVTGASGYIGSAVARAFIRAGWTVYGLVRRQEAVPELESQQITPILGSPDDLKWLPSLYEQTRALSVIVSVTENIAEYMSHYNNIVAMLRSIAEKSNAEGVRPLVLFTSGCKDYGRTRLANDPNLTPSMEDEPIKAPNFAVQRANGAVKIFENNDLFDAALLRPTTVYGLTSSYYADAFIRAGEAKAAGGSLIVPADAESIMHGCHVDDCGDAYVALAQHPDRSAVGGQAFNISAHRYETAKEVAEALQKEYGLAGVKYQPEHGTEDTNFGNMLWAFSQWVSSEKIRKLTGWNDKLPHFAQGIGQYRREYELAKSQGNYAVKKTAQRLEAVRAAGGFRQSDEK